MADPSGNFFYQEEEFKESSVLPLGEPHNSPRILKRPRCLVLRGTA